MTSGVRTAHAEVLALGTTLNDRNRLTASKGQAAIESGGFVGQRPEELFVARSAMGRDGD
jgi:hypothetical protein